MEQENVEKKVDIDFILKRGVADYSDDDLVVLDKLGAVPMGDTVQLDMAIIMFISKGRLQGDVNGKTYEAKEGDVAVCLPNYYLSNYMMSPDMEAKIVGLSYSAIQRNMQMNEDMFATLSYLAKNPIIHLDSVQRELLLKYYDIVSFKLKNPHGYFHKEIMHSIFVCFFSELFATIAPNVQYVDDGATVKQANLIFSRFMEMLVKNNGKVRSVKDYADELCISPKYLSFVSKSVSGKTALEIIHKYTVESIIRYLKHSNLTIKQIADILDFPNVSFFGKFTKSHLGMAPTEFRRTQSIKKKQ
jgi:AraC family transcriptional regulator, transcriptional activator of pobA